MFSLNRFETFVRRCPSLLLGAVIFICCLVFFGSQDAFNPIAFNLGFVLILMALSYAFYAKAYLKQINPQKAPKQFALQKTRIYYFVFLIFGTFLSVALTLATHRALVVGLFGTVALLALWCILRKIGATDIKTAVILLFAAAFLVRLIYVLYTGIDVRQHDVETFGSGIGHSGYIEYFYNYKKLPNFDVREVWQFYHPPLHHILAAFHLRVMTFFGVPYDTAVESLQMLTLYYSMLSLLISYRILRELQISSKALIAVFAVLCFHPTFIILSGSINNDILAVTFFLGALLYSIRWYKNCTVKNILKIALCIGLGMMTKLSVWMVAPAVAVLFLIALIKNHKKIKRTKYLLQFTCFGAVCLPLGLWWSVRNYILWQVPPSYVPRLETDSFQYIGNHAVLERLFNFNFRQFLGVYDRWGDPYFEFNPTVGLLKTAMFGEYINDTAYPSIAVFGFLLFWLGAVLALISVIAYVTVGIKDSKIPAAVRCLLLITVATTIAMYYYFCLEFPFTCTQNIRYAAVTVPVGAAFIGRLCMKLDYKKSRISAAFKNIIFSVCGLFCFNSWAMFLAISMYK